MAELTERPFPPGDYPAVVIGSGPGGLQTSYSLNRLGVRHAFLSADERPAGMFRRWPFFQRLISWTKPFAPAERGSRWYEWFDWNSLIAEEPENRALAPRFMDGTSEFPSRAEMQRQLEAFADGTGTRARPGCRWERVEERGGRFVVATTDGEYVCDVVVVATGMTEPWKPEIPGIEEVPHYADTEDPATYEDKNVFIIGKRNSGFELADGLLPRARRIVLGSPRPARLSILERTVAAARARYMQPYEDHVLGGGVFVLDASIERVERRGGVYVVHASGTTRPGDLSCEADVVIAATGFGTPLANLRELGVRTFSQDRLPMQTQYWESADVPGIYFAGSITQGSVGLKKYGKPGGSASVHGLRYNARALARHLAETRFGVKVDHPEVAPDEVVPYLLAEATRGPELWNQPAYLCRALHLEDGRILDDGIEPLAQFTDASGPDAVAISVENDDEGDIHPALYLRRAGDVEEHLLDGDALHDFTGEEHRAQLSAVMKGFLD